MNSWGRSQNSLGVNPFALKAQQEKHAALALEEANKKAMLTQKKEKRRFEAKQSKEAKRQRTNDAKQLQEQRSIDDSDVLDIEDVESFPAVDSSGKQKPLIRINQKSLFLDAIDTVSGAEVELKWVLDLGSDTDLESIPVNPAPYDTPLNDSLPFDFDNVILLSAMNSILHSRKFLWLCLTTNTLFWLVGSVPNTLHTWRESMLRRCKLVLSKKQGICCEDVNQTVLFKVSKRFYSKSATMQDVLNQNTRAAGVNRDRKCTLAVDKTETTPLIKGLKLMKNSVLTLQSRQRVLADPDEKHFKMGEGCLSGVPVVPLKISVAQVSRSILALDHAIPPDLFFGSATMREATMDVDNAVFAMTAETIAMKSATSVQRVIHVLQGILPILEQSSNVMFVPSGEWQRMHKTGPTVRPVNGGSWWQLSSPKHTREPCRMWLHSPGFLDIAELKSAAIDIANELFEKYDTHNPERMKLDLENTHDECKVPGGFLFPLALGVMACRIGENVSICVETFGNKSYGLKLNDCEISFGNDDWAHSVEDQFLTKITFSILTMMNKITDPLLGCFCLKPEYVSIGFGFSTSYCDNRSCPLFSVCKNKDWMNANEHESFCTMALQESMCPHTTHFKSGPILRVQAYIEALNCITDRQCGSGKPLYSPIGFSALNKVASGEVNISAILEGFNKDFARVDNAMRTLHEHPRNRTEIQVRCIVDSAGNIKWNSMIQAAAKVIVGSTQHWPLDHVLSFSSLNAAAMFLVAQQSWRLACDVNIKLKDRQALLDIGTAILKRWKSFKTGGGDGTTGPKNNKRLVDIPKLCDCLLSNLNKLLPSGKQFLHVDDKIEVFSESEIVVEHSFGTLMNQRIEQNLKSASQKLSCHILKCCTCNKLFYGSSNKELLEVHLQVQPSCRCSDWSAQKLVTAQDWNADYLCRLQHYSIFLESCSLEQKEVCESVLKFGSGVLAVGIAGAGKSVALNHIGDILESVFFEPGELVRCAATGLLAQYFHSAASTVHSAIGAYPDFGSAPNWNLSVSEWRNLLISHGKVTSKLKVFINTEVYAQSSNMLQAFFEIRKDEEFRFLSILDGDPPQPMHEDDKVSDAHANVQLCGINDHFLLKRDEIYRLLPEVRVVLFETPMRQKDPKVHALSHAVRHASAEAKHVQQMRNNEFNPQKHSVDIVLCALKRDSMLINSNNLKLLSGKEYIFTPIVTTNVPYASSSHPLILKIGAPVIFVKACKVQIVGKMGRTRNIVNGSRGIIESCDDNGKFVIIILTNINIKVRVEAVPIDGERFSQIPVQLGWATTIKKAGGMTFNTVAIDFGLNWALNEEKLVQQAKETWRTSQAYGAITRSRTLAYFCHASKFKNAPMLALLNNQNLKALEFLRKLTESREHYVRTPQDKRSLSIQEDTLSAEAPYKKRKIQACKTLLEWKTLDNVVMEPMMTNKYPQTFARQAAGLYFTGMLLSQKGEEVLVKKSNQHQKQAGEILALKSLSGTKGVPYLMGTAGHFLILSHNGATPHKGPLQEVHLNDLSLIIAAMHNRGWTFESINRENVWTHGDYVTLFNFENAVQTSESHRLMSIDDFVRECNEIGQNANGDEDDTTPDNESSHSASEFHMAEENANAVTTISPPAAAPSDIHRSESGTASAMSSMASMEIHSDPKNVCIRAAAQDVFEDPKTYHSVLQNWKRKSQQKRLKHVSELWNCTHQKLYPSCGPKTSYEAGMKGHRPGSLGYGEASIDLCMLMCEVYKEYSSLPQSSQSFVDIGSGIGNVVLQMAALNAETYSFCFGIELVTNRAHFAKQASDVFTKKAVKSRIPFCEIRTNEGDCFRDSFCKNALRCAGLVWINNEVFKEEDDIKLLDLLNLVAPVGCIVMSFRELLVTKRHQPTTPQSNDAPDFVVRLPRELANSNSWDSDPSIPKKVYIIQRTTISPVVELK